MNRRYFLKKIGMGATVAFAASVMGPLADKVSAADPAKPNILLFHIDDLGWSDVSCYVAPYGEVYIETPNIDQLAADGIRFTDGYATCCVCSPSRASVMTGKYPQRTGITNHLLASGAGEGYPSSTKEVLCPGQLQDLAFEEVTVAEILKGQGYKTCHLGKWHLNETASMYPQYHGFDKNVGGISTGRPGSGYHHPYSYGSLVSYEGSYLSYQLAEETIDFIQESYDESKPFFINFCHYAVHEPIIKDGVGQGPADLTAKYEAKSKPSRYSSVSSLVDDYAAMTEAVDIALGQVIAKLEQLNIRNNTLIVFTSDNGGHRAATSNWPLRGSKQDPYEGGVREPWIASWPGVIPAGVVSDEQVTGVDILPTFCDVARASLPAGQAIDGVSLLPVMKGTGELKKRCLYWHYPHYNSYNLPPNSFIRAGDWKLIRWYAGDTKYELFNLKDDLSEKYDLADKMPDKVKELDEKLTRWLRETGARLPIPNPAYTGVKKKKRVKAG